MTLLVKKLTSRQAGSGGWAEIECPICGNKTFSVDIAWTGYRVIDGNKSFAWGGSGRCWSCGHSDIDFTKDAAEAAK